MGYVTPASRRPMREVSQLPTPVARAAFHHHTHMRIRKRSGVRRCYVCVCASGLGLTLRKGARWAECARASLLREGCVGGNGGGRVTVCESMDGSEGDVSSVRPSRAVSNSDVFFFSVFSLANSENSKAKKLQPPKKKSDVRGMGGMGYGVCGVWGIWGMGGIWGTGDMVYGVKYRVMWWWAYIFNTRKWKIRNKMLGGRKSRGMGYGVWDVWGTVYMG